MADAASEQLATRQKGLAVRLMQPHVRNDIATTFDEAPYLQRYCNMEFQGGGYATLRALWEAEHAPSGPGLMTINQSGR